MGVVGSTWGSTGHDCTVIAVKSDFERRPPMAPSCRSNDNRVKLLVLDAKSCLWWWPEAIKPFPIIEGSKADSAGGVSIQVNVGGRGPTRKQKEWTVSPGRGECYPPVEIQAEVMGERNSVVEAVCSCAESDHASKESAPCRDYFRSEAEGTEEWEELPLQAGCAVCPECQSCSKLCHLRWSPGPRCLRGSQGTQAVWWAPRACSLPGGCRDVRIWSCLSQYGEPGGPARKKSSR